MLIDRLQSSPGKIEQTYENLWLTFGFLDHTRPLVHEEMQVIEMKKDFQPSQEKSCISELRADSWGVELMDRKRTDIPYIQNYFIDIGKF